MLEDLLNFHCECTTGWTGATCERSKDTHFDPDEKFIKFSRDKINLNPIRNLKKKSLSTSDVSNFIIQTELGS